MHFVILLKGNDVQILIIESNKQVCTLDYTLIYENKFEILNKI